MENVFTPVCSVTDFLATSLPEISTMEMFPVSVFVELMVTWTTLENGFGATVITLPFDPIILSLFVSTATSVGAASLVGPTVASFITLQMGDQLAVLKAT